MGSAQGGGGDGVERVKGLADLPRGPKEGARGTSGAGLPDTFRRQV